MRDKEETTGSNSRARRNEMCRKERKRHTELASLKELGFKKNFATSGDFVEASRELANCVAV
jgi:hypothetical protein